MTEVCAKSPTVFTVNSGPPPLPPRTRTRRRQLAPSQVLLLLLVSVALCGMLVEAWLIYRLYHPVPVPVTRGEASQPSALKMIGKASTVESEAVEWDKPFEAPSKPLAHLTDGPDVKAHHKYIMSWSEVPDLFLYKVNYKDGRLVFQESGFYYVYSKVTFIDVTFVSHSVEWNTKLHYGKKSITLLESILRSPRPYSNSFLAGVFHFHKDDAIFVKVSDTSHVSHHDSTENVFGAYMI